MDEGHTYPGHPAHIDAYVEALGPEVAVGFFLEFGGAELYLAASPKRSALVDTIGKENAQKLAAVAHRLPARVPVPKKWLAHVLKSKGLSNAAIARKLHVTDVTVRSYLKGAGFSSGHDPRQLPLL